MFCVLYLDMSCTRQKCCPGHRGSDQAGTLLWKERLILV